MNYKDKQEWIEAVMASDLGAATKVYAYGIFKHMYGNKVDAFPGAKAIAEATGLATGKFYLHNKALEGAGFLEVTHRSGRSNFYELTNLPTEVVGTHPQKREHPPTEEVTPPTFVGTNTTRNTTMNTPMENNKDEAVDTYTLNSSDLILAPALNLEAYNYVVTTKGVTKQLDPPTEVVGSDDAYDKGEKYLERLLAKNGIVGERRSLARRRYADEDYEPSITGMSRAGWVLTYLSEPVLA